MEQLIGTLVGGALFGGGLIFIIYRARIRVYEGQISQLEESLNQERLGRKEELQRVTETYEARLNDLKVTDEKLNQSFSHLAAKVLDQNTSRFQEFASKDLKQLHTQSVGELEQKRQFFEHAIKDMSERIRESQEKISKFERERGDMYTRLESQMTKMFEQEQLLLRETERLKTALTTSHSVRGRWGELVLRNILNSSDLVEGVDFEEQKTTVDDTGALFKPDFIIRLPQPGQQLVIDCKTSIFDGYEAEGDEATLQLLHEGFCKKVRARVNELSSKEYQKNVTDSAPYVIMFIPSEAAIRAAFHHDRELFQWAMNKKVFIASPATIIPLILLVSKAWNEFKLSSEAKELSEVVGQLGTRLHRFVERMSKVQRGLEAAVKGWNEAIDLSWNGKQSVMKSIEKARELGGNISEISALTPTDVAPRRLDYIPDEEDDTIEIKSIDG